MTINQTTLNQFLEHAVYDLSAGYAGVMISLGHKLGLYQVMANAGQLTSAEIADKAGCDERYVREWLSSQAAGGYVLYHPEDETFALSPEQAVVLADTESPYFIPNAWNVPASLWLDEDKTLETFKTGKGLGWDEHDGRLFCGVAAFFRNGYKANLVQQWLPNLNGVIGKLELGIKVADVGCGYGHSTIFMAKAFPNSSFYGFDYHQESIEEARKNAELEGVADRVQFEVASAKELPDHQYGLVCFFDCLHDMGDPVGAATHARKVTAEGGTVMLVEPYAEDNLEDNINPIGQLYYAASTTLCCAHSKSEEVGLALGAQAGEARLAEVFTEAGFASFRRATETPFNLVLEARR